MKQKAPGQLKKEVRAFERARIREMITLHGTRVAAANMLGISTQALRKKLGR